MITPRPRRCPLRQPRIWLWAVAVALPAHIAVAAALSWQGQGTLVACPVTTPLKVRLHQAEASPAIQAATATPLRQPAAMPTSKPVATPRSTPTRQAKNTAAPTSAPTTASLKLKGSAAPSRGDLQPAAAPASLGVMAAAQLGFRTPPQPPHYPPASRARAEEGTTTVLALLVSQGGRAQELKLERSSGYARLDHAALAAAARWEFNPPPAPTWVRVPVRFALTE